MTKGTYNVGSNNGPAPSKDGSFRSCLCAMLVFVAICVILLLAAWPWRSSKEKLSPKEEEQNWEGIFNGYKSSNKSEKIIEQTEKPWTTSLKTTPKTTTPKIVYEKTNKPIIEHIPETTKPPETTVSTQQTQPNLIIIDDRDFTTRQTTLSKDIEDNKEPITTTAVVKTTYSEELNSSYTTERITTQSLDDEKSTTQIVEATTKKDKNQYFTPRHFPSKTTTEITETTTDFSTVETTTEELDATSETTFEPSTTEETLQTTLTLKENLNSSSGESTETTTELAQTSLKYVPTTTKATTATTIATTTTTTEPPTTESLTTTTTPKTPTTTEEMMETPFELNETDEIPDESPTYNKRMAKTISQPSIFKLQKPVCQSLGCKKIAARMLTRINHIGDPCEDFYEYACGGDNNDKAEDEDNWKRIKDKLYEINGSSPAYLKTFRNFYDSCVDFHSDFNFEKRVIGAKAIFDEVGQFYDRNQQIPAEMTLTELLAKLLLVDATPLFDISVDVGKQSQNFVLQMTIGKKSSLLQGEASMTKEQKKCFRNLKNPFSKLVNVNDLYKKYINCQNNHSDYLNTVESAVKAFGGFAHLPVYNATWHMQDLRTTLEWDILAELEKFPNPGSKRQATIKKNYRVFKISELKLRYPLIEWDILFSRLVRKPVDNEQLVQVYFETYFQSLFKQLKSLPSWKVHNALLAMFAHELYSNLIIPAITKDQESFCLHQTSRLLKEVTSSMFLNSWTASDISYAQSEVNRTFTQLKTNLTDVINDEREEDWLDVSSKISLLRKVEKLTLIADSGVNVWRNETFVNSRAGDVLNDINVDYQQYAITLVRRHRKLLYDLWGEYSMAPENMWWHYLTPYSTSPIFIYSLNVVVVPLGMVLNIPRDIPRYITLAKLGYPLAKAIGHHFDTVGVNYDMTLSKDSAFSYKSLDRCNIDKFSLGMSQFVDGKIFSFNVTDPGLSLNERIVEDMAVKLISDISVDVLNDPLLPWVSDNFSREKVFLLAIAQEHCKSTPLSDYVTSLFESENLPPSLLIKSFYGNLRTFSDTFECRTGSGMYHPLKCDPFPELHMEEDVYNYDENK